MALHPQGGVHVFHADGIVDLDAAHEQQLPLVSQAADVVHHLANGHRFLKIDQIAAWRWRLREKYFQR